MRLKINIAKEPKHTELVSGVCWSGIDEVFSVADDHQIIKWNLLNNENSTVAKLPEAIFPTDMRCLPRAGGVAARSNNTAFDVYAVSSTDGKLMLINRNGKVEKSVDAHAGAVLSVRWNHTGSDIITAGEDGTVKIWSRSGMLRSTLCQTSSPIYAISWSPDSDHVLYSSGKQLVIKPIQPNSKPNTWKAHEGIILSVDWNTVNNNIISGAEDCKYKVWDSYGRLLHSSMTHEYPITSVAWSPDGDLFAVGSYNTLRLCDAAGWSYSLDKPSTGSIFNIGWSGDSTQLAGACGNGHVIFGHIGERRLEWNNFEVVVATSKLINVRNITNDAKEKLDFRDRVIKVSIAYKNMIVVTSNQCYIYSITNWNTPLMFELKEGNVTLILQAEKCFLLIDGSSIYVYSYDGRLVSNVKLQSQRSDVLNSQTLSISDDTIALCDKTDNKAVQFFETMTGKPLADGRYQHSAEVVEIGLNHTGQSSERRLALVDKNRDIFLVQVRSVGVGRKTVKLGTMIESFCWNDTSSMLAVLADSKLFVWLYPNTAYVDKNLLSKTIYEKDASEFGKNAILLNFLGSNISLRRSDGSRLSTSILPYYAILQDYAQSNKWDDAVRLCRFIKEDSIWACLAALSTYNKQLNTAEVAYAALGEMEKVQFLGHIRSLPSKELRAAEMALFSGQVAEAEGILLQSSLIFRAIMFNLQLFRWERALELALKHKSHLDTVIGYRDQFLKKLGKKETSKRFIQYSEGVKYDWEIVLSKVQAEYQKEREQAGISK